MKKRVKFSLFVLFVIGVIILGLTYKNKAEVSKTKRKKQNNLAIMIKEDGATDYTKSNSKDIPKGDYVLNRDKSYCKNNGVIGDYDSTLGKVSFSFIGTDSCFLYFDYKEDTSLYGTIKKRAKTDNTYLALYEGEGADTYANPVYYYKGNVQNNNVLFAGFCWKIVRTTETGGVKIVYNGVQKDVINTDTLNENDYTITSNDASFPFTFNNTKNVWENTNTENYSSGSIKFRVNDSGNYYLSFSETSAGAGDYIAVKKNDTSITSIIYDNNGGNSGKPITDIYLENVTESDLIEISYARDQGTSTSIRFNLKKVIDVSYKSCNNTGTDSQIGTSAFSNDSNSPAYVGYMHNIVYPYSSKAIINSAYFSGTKAYGDGVTYASNKYTLTNATTLSVSSSNISTLVGKYTCNSSSTIGTCTKAWYIVGYSGTSIYYYSLSGGDLDGTDNDQDYVFGSSFTYANGTYTLTGTATINSDNWTSQNSNVNTHHYTCLSSGTTCSSIYYVYYIKKDIPYYITLTGGKSVNDALNEMLYADDVNKNDSTIKAYIDSWYESNIKDKYDNKLEDTVFCNDRSMSNESSNGWNPDGGSISTDLQFKNFYMSNPSLVCTNDTDRFSMSNPKAKLSYPIGLLSVPELSLAGYGSNHYFNNGQYVWLASPNQFYYDNASVGAVGSSGRNRSNVYISLGVRPSVSLKPKTYFSSGDGSFTNPFVIGDTVEEV